MKLFRLNSKNYSNFYLLLKLFPVNLPCFSILSLWGKKDCICFLRLYG
jgi:hypothetical protein